MKKLLSGMLVLLLSLSLSMSAMAAHGHSRNHGGQNNAGRSASRVERQTTNRSACPYNENCPYPGSGECRNTGSCIYAGEGRTHHTQGGHHNQRNR